MTETLGAVEADAEKSRSMRLGMGGVMLLGVGAIAAGASLEISAALWLGVLLLGGGLLGQVAMTFVGGAGRASCPRCSATFAVQQTRRRRVAPCPQCGTWLAGVERMKEVAADAWEKRPTFATLLPDAVRWTPSCACCDAPSVRSVSVTSVRPPGTPVATVVSIDVPVCERHADPNGHVGLVRASNVDTIAFQSLQALQRFAKSNGVSEVQGAEAFWKQNEAARPLE